MPRNMAPANISSVQDLVQYNVADAAAVDLNAPPGYIERYIHSEIYRRFPGVKSVIHSHASTVIPYSITGVPLRACLHMTEFLGATTPVYDIAKYYESDSTRDLVIRNGHLGESLAACFGDSLEDTNQSESGVNDLKHSVVLMRGHGYTVASQGIEEYVYKAIYARENAAVQSTSLGLLAAYDSASGGRVPDIVSIHNDELVATGSIARTAWGRVWSLWVREVQAVGLYVHDD
ncbi:uncharacterized protein A1O9_08760 [Exophiala aquamarina CBS 119918]|uniref:Class II aldolase/adducin N-terminal domain-containing protein n=1 Tax=Exophiala aquamarina CBS 119918 TaxID=1182545 RepID=A0A072P5V8_9EURO|nr:uncharacterized protein A1O9_08760 [Exophiala aquamarina CBS 119918]KEF55107.1 hypothetical protein A1O9_08760 [Exophiala aquamarina CBS 119918]